MAPTMPLTLSLITLLALAAGLVLLIYRLDQSDQKRQIRYYLNSLRHMRLLLEHIPQHRGAANALLNGDDSFREKLSGLQKQIQTDIQQLDQLFASRTPAAKLLDRWKRTKAGWSGITAQLNSFAAHQSFEKHSNLIAEIIYLISDTVDESRISSHTGVALRNIAFTAFNQVPVIVETCGQARGIGAGIMAKGSLPPPDKIKMSFLHKRLEQTSDYVAHKLAEDNRGGHHLIPAGLLEENRRKTISFLNTITDHILAPENGTAPLSANDYFAIGSAAIESNMKIFDLTVTLIERAVAK